MSGCLTKEDNKRTDIDKIDIDKTDIEEVNNMQNMSIFTEAFKEGENIPGEYTCDGENISPVLFWTWRPTETKSIALIMDDPDAPGGTFVHWVLYNIPPETDKLNKGFPKEKIFRDGTTQGVTDFGRIGYGGPCPPSGSHRYFFRIYALDKKLDLFPGATRGQVDDAMKGHIIAKGELMGRYKRR